LYGKVLIEDAEPLGFIRARGQIRGYPPMCRQGHMIGPELSYIIRKAVPLPLIVQRRWAECSFVEPKRTQGCPAIVTVLILLHYSTG